MDKVNTDNEMCFLSRLSKSLKPVPKSLPNDGPAKPGAVPPRKLASTEPEMAGQKYVIGHDATT